MIEVNAAALSAHPFLHGMPADQLGVLAEAARDVKFPARHRLFEDGGNATRFWLIQSGHVSLDVHIPGEGPVVIETIGMGELLGWSWLFPPYKWAFGAVAATAVEAFEFDAPVVRESLRRRARTRVRTQPAHHPGPGQAVAGHQDQDDRSFRLLGSRALTTRAPPEQGRSGGRACYRRRSPDTAANGSDFQANDGVTLGAGAPGTAWSRFFSVGSEEIS